MIGEAYSSNINISKIIAIVGYNYSAEQTAKNSYSEIFIHAVVVTQQLCCTIYVVNPHYIYINVYDEDSDSYRYVYYS